MPEPPEPQPKRIIICCDGTWQSAVSGEENTPSNITRLGRCLNRAGVDKAGKTWQQVVWYDSGVGTTSGWLGKKREGAIGAGIEGNVIEAYNFVVLNWAPGDQVMVFGFSRGAYTARSIAGLISDIGICQPWQLQDFHEIWEAYKANTAGERFEGSRTWFDYVDGIPGDDKDQPDGLSDKDRDFVWRQRPGKSWARTPESKEIEVVGVYDTVGALGLPSVQGIKFGFGADKHGFHNVKLNPNIKHAFHALALDERREAFTPTLWHLPERIRTTDADLELQQKRVEEAKQAWLPKAYDKKVPLEERKRLKSLYNDARRALLRMEESRKPRSQLLQVWFPGVHINIGGGSSDTLVNEGDLEEMANITFSWMLDQISPYVSINEMTVWYDDNVRQEHIAELNDNIRRYNESVAREKEKTAAMGWGQWALSTVSSAVTQPFTKSDAPNTLRRDFGWGTGTIIDSYTLMYRLNGAKPRTPGKYAVDGEPSTQGVTNEQVHPTVGYRVAKMKGLGDKKLVYTPAGLAEDKFQRRKKAGGGFEYVLGDVTLPEYKIKPRDKDSGVPSFERHTAALDREKTTPYLKELDAVNGFPVEPLM